MRNVTVYSGDCSGRGGYRHVRAVMFRFESAPLDDARALRLSNVFGIIIQRSMIFFK